MNSAFVGSIGSIYQWAINAGDGIIMQAGSLAIEPIELDVTFMNKKGNKMPDINDIMDYENGDMDFERICKFFQGLIDSGMAWRLQGHYGRMANHLIMEGWCSPREKVIEG